MRCAVCDTLLTDYETKRKHPKTGEYLDTCSRCLSSIQEIVDIGYVETYEYEGEKHEEADEN